MQPPKQPDTDVDALQARADAISSAAQEMAKTAIKVRDQHARRVDALVTEMRRLSAANKQIQADYAELQRRHEEATKRYEDLVRLHGGK